MRHIRALLLAVVLLVVSFGQAMLATAQDDECFAISTGESSLPRSIEEDPLPTPPPLPGESSAPGGVVLPPPLPGESVAPGDVGPPPTPPGGSGAPGDVIPSGQPGGSSAPSGNGPAFDIPDEIPECVTEARVVRVIDGETIEVEITERRDPAYGQTLTVRLLLIDAPGNGTSGGPEECFGDEAADRAAALLSDRTVYLERDASETDPEGRLLRHVWFEHDGKPFLANEQLVRDGDAVLAWTLPDVLYMEWIWDAELQAQADNAGLWRECGGLR